MKAFIILAVVACARAQVVAPYAGLPLGYAGAGVLPYAYNGLGYNGLAYNGLAGAPIAATTYAAAAPILAAPYAPASSQYSAQDEFGNINYGYSNINSAKMESGNAYGGVTGSYSYVDANGIPQTVNYIADALGYRVAATNLPIATSVDLAQPVFDLVGPAPVDDTEEVKAAKADFMKAFEEAKAASAARKRRDADLVTVPASTEPLVIAAPAPLAVAAPYTVAAAPFGYAQAAPLAYAGAPLAYAGANLAYTGAPLAYAGANLAYAGAPLAYAGANLAYAGAPLAYAGAPLAAPIAAAPVVSAPAGRDAILTKIQLNPGHAVSYIVN
jgi:hypothetical protein